MTGTWLLAFAGVDFAGLSWWLGGRFGFGRREPEGVPDPFPELRDIADRLLAEAGRMVTEIDAKIAELQAKSDAAEIDPEADKVALEAAKTLAGGQLRNGHFRGVRAHLRGLRKGMGAEYVADYLEALTEMYAGPLRETEGLQAEAREVREWARLRANMAKPRHRRPNMRETVEEAVAE